MAEALSPPAVDAHAHVFTRTMRFAADAHSRPDYAYPVEAWLADLDEAGIARGVIAAASLFDDGNAYTLAALAASPRLRATVLAPPETGLSVLRDMARRGVTGVRLTWRRLAALPDLGAEPWRGFLRRVADCGMHVELLAGSTQLPVVLPEFAEAGVPSVVDHFGVPSRDPAEREAGTQALLRAVATGRAWVKLSAGFRMPFGIAAEVTARLLAEAGPERLLWGSDAPFVNHEAVRYADTLDLYRRLVPDATTRAAIDRTALALYFNEGNA
ncbi:amidohydrolase family protein [Sphingomonas psychrotolerans]|uniref:Amidohydrolase family protein n=1 Tax=Sphingomonas psychrotolerans TaxID=1327635 RepID=A0ABU3N740_9SPHN|nr:amidohydrolase family protein [Sphingomonas psychrotolerans]MDT8760208.1 amidohydrolase family protein [Sphingomonas psychrotolerans]